MPDFAATTRIRLPPPISFRIGGEPISRSPPGLLRAVWLLVRGAAEVKDIAGEQLLRPQYALRYSSSKAITESLVFVPGCE